MMTTLKQYIYIIYVLILDWSFFEEIYRDEIDALFVKCPREFTTPKLHQLQLEKIKEYKYLRQLTSRALSRTWGWSCSVSFRCECALASSRLMPLTPLPISQNVLPGAIVSHGKSKQVGHGQTMTDSRTKDKSPLARDALSPVTSDKATIPDAKS